MDASNVEERWTLLVEESFFLSYMTNNISLFI